MKETLSPLARLRRDIREYTPGVLIALFSLTLIHLLFGTVCPMRIFFGLPCPACGITRALQSFLRGDVASCLAYQPLFPFLAAGLLFFLISRYFFPKVLRFFLPYAILSVVLLIIVYVCRMFTQFGTDPTRFYEKDCIFLRLWEWLKMLSESV